MQGCTQESASTHIHTGLDRHRGVECSHEQTRESAYTHTHTYRHGSSKKCEVLPRTNTRECLHTHTHTSTGRQRSVKCSHEQSQESAYTHTYRHGSSKKCEVLPRTKTRECLHTHTHTHTHTHIQARVVKEV